MPCCLVPLGHRIGRIVEHDDRICPLWGATPLGGGGQRRLRPETKGLRRFTPIKSSAMKLRGGQRDLRPAM